MSYRFAPWVWATATAALAAVPVSALADVRASARLSNFGYSLIDLNPGDGIAPAVTFRSELILSLGAAYVAERGMDASGNPLPALVERKDAWQSPGVMFPEISRAASLPSAQGTVTLSGSVTAHSFSAVLEGHLGNTHGDGVYSSELVAYATPLSFLTRAFAVELAPYTGLVWTGQAHIEVQKDGRGSGPRYERAQARVAAFFMDAQGVTDGQSIVLGTVHQRPGLLTQSADLQLSFANPRGEAAAINFGTALSIGGSTSMQPVPEPGAAALLLCGLGVVGVAARRGGARTARAA